MPERMSCPIGEFKALSESDGPGTFEALVAVFGNVDHGGDKIRRGAFKTSLAEWKANGRSIPVLWSHDTETVPLGVVTEAAETREGLKVKARLLVDDHPQAKAVYAAMKAGALHEFSFAYKAVDHEQVTESGEDVRVLKELKIFEVSPVFRGMNPATHLMGVKSIGALEKERADLEKRLAEVKNQLSELNDDPEVVQAIEEAVSSATSDVAWHSNTTDLTEQLDKPDPKAPSEEDQARITALLLAHPEHVGDVT
jgi:HK97 family phage prohead protease